jgi:PST family polysaccharide transporter
MGTALLLMIGSIFTASFISSFFGEPQLAPIVRCLSLNFLFTALQSIQVAILNRKLAFKKLAIRSLVSTLISGLLGVVLAWQGFGVWSLVIQQISNYSINVLILWKVSNWYPSFRFSSRHFCDLFSFSVNVLGFNILRFFNQRSDDFLIGYFLGTVALGYYTVAYRLLRVMVDILVNTTAKVAIPTFSRIQKDRGRMLNGFYRVTQLTSFVAFPTFIGVGILASELVKELFGENWLPSVPVMQVLVLVGIIQSISNFNGIVMLAMGKPHWKLAINCLNVILNVIGFMLVVNLGIVAVALAFFVTNLLVTPISLWLIYKLIDLNIKIYCFQYFPCLFSSLAMAFSIIAIKSLLPKSLDDILVLIVCTSIGVLVYLLMILVTAPNFSKQLIKLLKIAT